MSVPAILVIQMLLVTIQLVLTSVYAILALAVTALTAQVCITFNI